MNKIIKFFLDNKLVTFLLLAVFILWGIVTAPFDWKTGILPRDPVPVDAIPDIGENQQIVFTKWSGRSPQDIEDQISYPLTTALLGIPGVKTIRSNSMFGFSSIYIIFKDNIDFYWSRSRILEKLNSLPPNLLPKGVKPTLGPDATALGQIYWYTLEGRDSLGKATGGWSLDELRTLQDFYIKYSLASVDGVSEVASIGGFQKEYQIDLNPAAMQAYGVTLQQVINAVKNSNLDIGAKTIEINKVEYFIRGIGYIKNISDINETVVAVNDNTPVRIKDIATVKIGPAERRGVLDKAGNEAVGGVIVARYGSNPMQVINNVKAKIKLISSGLPTKVLPDGTVSHLTIVPFYDRSNLIKETLGTLDEALTLEIIITIIVIILMVMNLRASILISALIPVAVLMTFIAMRYFGVQANIVALSGIAIAIGTIVDTGIVISENIIRHRQLQANKGKAEKKIIYEAVIEVAPAVITAILTTIVSFIPVFTLQAAEGKLFRPLAFTKTFVLTSALVFALAILPALAHLVFSAKVTNKRYKIISNSILVLAGIALMIMTNIIVGLFIVIFGGINIAKNYIKGREKLLETTNIAIVGLLVIYLLAQKWMPLGVANSMFSNYLFIIVIISILLGFFMLLIKYYKVIMNFALKHKALFIFIPLFIFFFGVFIWQGWNKVFGFVSKKPKSEYSSIRKMITKEFPGIQSEFMPALDEGSFLLMPTTMPHTGVAENTKIIKTLDRAIQAIPEVKSVVGKAGRVNSALDPAPVSMFEIIINYKSEYKTDANGNRLRFKVDKKGLFVRDSANNLIPDKKGQYFRQWRKEIHSPQDIWNLITQAAAFPGITSAPKLQPIQTRIVMLQTGMRSPIGIKVFGDNLDKIEAFGLKLEKILQQVPSIKASTVFAERVVGKPYLEIEIDRAKIARYGLSINRVQKYISVAIGGMPLTQTVQGRERYAVRVRYPRELRNNPNAINKILIPTKAGKTVTLDMIANIKFVKGPQVIKSENTFLTSYVTFGASEGHSEIQAVNDAQALIKQKIKSGQLILPAGITYEFAGNYKNQIRASKRFSIVIPIVLLIVFFILYFQFKKVSSTLFVFSGIAVAFGGGFIMLWLYAQPWFMDFSVAGMNMRDIFQIRPFYLSIAVWVGFIALFGIATDDGVLMTTYIDDLFAQNKPKTITDIRKTIIEAGSKRIRPSLMTAATTILALMPVLSSTGKGSDIMVPMAIPIFGGMTFQLITLFVVPMLYGMKEESQLKKSLKIELK